MSSASTSNQSTSSGSSQSSNQSVSSSGQSANFCNAFSLVGGGAMGGLAAQALGGPNIDTSASAQSSFAKNVSDFVREALEEALDGSVSTDCFYEASMDDGGGLWVALSLPGEPPSGLSQTLADIMTEREATVTGAFSSNSSAGSFNLVGFEALPFDAPGGGPISGAVYFVTTEEDDNVAVLVAGYSSETEDQSESMSQVGTGTGDEYGYDPSGAADGPTPTPVPVVVSGNAAQVNDQLKPALESALGVSLTVENFFNSSAGGISTVSVSYLLAEDLPAGANPAAALSEVGQSLGGEVSSSFAGGGVATVTLQGLTLGELTGASGTLTLAEGRVTFLLTNSG